LSPEAEPRTEHSQGWALISRAISLSAITFGVTSYGRDFFKYSRSNVSLSITSPFGASII
jgi:hypothetical protein